jgi:hypothetical protein
VPVFVLETVAFASTVRPALNIEVTVFRVDPGIENCNIDPATVFCDCIGINPIDTPRVFLGWMVPTPAIIVVTATASGSTIVVISVMDRFDRAIILDFSTRLSRSRSRLLSAGTIPATKSKLAYVNVTRPP